MTVGPDIKHLRDWIGREQIVEDRITEALARKYHATFDLPGDAPQSGQPVPRLIHFCLAQPAEPTAGLGPDGHPARGGFLPLVPLPRRMWAGGAITFHRDLRVGNAVHRVSRVDNVVMKHGRTGPLCFVTISHRIIVDGDLAVEERQDIVYSEPHGGGARAGQSGLASRGRCPGSSASKPPCSSAIRR